MNVHIDNYCAQTGISKFLELNRKHGWIYDKTENLKNEHSKLLNFTHLLVEAENEYDPVLVPFKSSHKILSFIRTYSGFHISQSNPSFYWLPIKLKITPKVFILNKV